MEVPLDVLLDIAARSQDAATIARCAAACRHLRRGILDPSFLHLLDLRAAAIGPVVAASYEIVDHSDSSCGDDDDVIDTTRRLRLDSSLLRSHPFKSARFELLLLWRLLPPKRHLSAWWHDTAEVDRSDMRVCNTFTGQVTSLPPSGLCIPRGVEPRGLYRCAFLAIDVAGGFELLVMDVELQTRTFFSEDGEWGPLRRLSSPRDIFTDEDATGLTCRSHAAVVGETVHWLCVKSDIRLVPASRHCPAHHIRENRLVILALQPDAVDGKVIALPQAFLERSGRRTTPIPTTTTCPPDWLMVAATAAGTRLSLVAAETDVISTWTLEDDDGGSHHWSRQVVVSKTEITRHLRDPDAYYARFQFEGYGEMSDSVLIRMVGVGLVQLNLGTNKATVLCSQPDPGRVVSWACLHETDLVSVLRGMKVF